MPWCWADGNGYIRVVVLMLKRAVSGEATAAQRPSEGTKPAVEQRTGRIWTAMTSRNSTWHRMVTIEVSRRAEQRRRGGGMTLQPTVPPFSD